MEEGLPRGAFYDRSTVALDELFGDHAHDQIETALGFARSRAALLEQPAPWSTSLLGGDRHGRLYRTSRHRNLGMS
jgi:hypothetical protein